VGLVDPHLFVPHRAFEETLDQAQAAIPDQSVLLVGRPGTGKSLWLRLLGERAAGHYRVVLCPFLHIPPAELEPWLLALLRGDARGESGQGLAARLRADPRPTVLLVDEIQSAPAETVAALVQLGRESDRVLKIVLAGAPGRGLDRARAELPRDHVMLALPDQLSEEEILEELDAILRHPALSGGLRERLSALDRKQVAKASRGVPRLLRMQVEEAGLALEGARALALRPRSRVRREAQPVVPPLPVFAARPRVPIIRPLRRSRSLAIPRMALALVATLFFANVGSTWAGRTLDGAEGWVAQASELPDVAGAPAATVASEVEEVRLNVNAVPWGEVSIDGRALGATPLGVSVPPGRYRFEVRLADGQVLRREVDVRPGLRRLAFRADEPR
jgi:MSHA biogenesis protein MshM